MKSQTSLQLLVLISFLGILHQVDQAVSDLAEWEPAQALGSTEPRHRPWNGAEGAHELHAAPTPQQPIVKYARCWLWWIRGKGQLPNRGWLVKAIDFPGGERGRSMFPKTLIFRSSQQLPGLCLGLWRVFSWHSAIQAYMSWSKLESRWLAKKLW